MRDYAFSWIAITGPDADHPGPVYFVKDSDAESQDFGAYSQALGVVSSPEGKYDTVERFDNFASHLAPAMRELVDAASPTVPVPLDALLAALQADRETAHLVRTPAGYVVSPVEAIDIQGAGLLDVRLTWRASPDGAVVVSSAEVPPDADSTSDSEEDIVIYTSTLSPPSVALRAQLGDRVGERQVARDLVGAVPLVVMAVGPDATERFTLPFHSPSSAARSCGLTHLLVQWDSSGQQIFPDPTRT